MDEHVKPLVFDSVESGSTKFDENWREIPDRRPLELLITLGNAVKTQEQKIAEMVKRELNKLAVSRGFETLEESEDFDLPGEDSIALSGYEFSEELSYMDKTPPPSSASADPVAAPDVPSADVPVNKAPEGA